MVSTQWPLLHGTESSLQTLLLTPRVSLFQGEREVGRKEGVIVMG